MLRVPLPRADGPPCRRLLQNATARSANKRRSAFKNLRTPWEESFAFTSAARRQINPATLRRIEELNAADQALWDLGDAILTRRLEEQRAAGALQKLPKPKEEPEPGEKKEPVPPVEDPPGAAEEGGTDAGASAEEGAGKAPTTFAPSEFEEYEDEDAYDDEEPPPRAGAADGIAAGEDNGGSASGDSVADEEETAHEDNGGSASGDSIADEEDTAHEDL
jgi:hypothetical protein